MPVCLLVVTTGQTFQYSMFYMAIWFLSRSWIRSMMSGLTCQARAYVTLRHFWLIFFTWEKNIAFNSLRETANDCNFQCTQILLVQETNTCAVKCNCVQTNTHSSEGLHGGAAFSVMSSNFSPILSCHKYTTSRDLDHIHSLSWNYVETHPN